MLALDPTDITEELPDDAVIPLRHLEFDHDIADSVSGENVDKAPAGRELNSPNAFVLVKTQRRVNAVKVARQIVPQVMLVCEL